MVYTVRESEAHSAISAVTTWIHSFGSPQSIVHDRGTAVINTDFMNWRKELGNTLHHERHTRIGLMAKIKTKIDTLLVIGGIS